MKLQLQVALVFLIGLILIHQGLCEEVVGPQLDTKNWTCTCSLPYQGNQSYVNSNCSRSCNCSPAARRSSEALWMCTCADNGFPKIASGNNYTTCFTACNCTSGSFNNEYQASRDPIASKVVVIVLLLCAIFTTLAFLASIGCYVYRRDKFSLQLPVLSSDRDTSCNSATNLISHGAIISSEAKVSTDSSVSGCFRKPSFLRRNKTEIVHGTITRFSCYELEFATNRFSNSNIIGLGGSSNVYRGQLKDGTTVAIKRIKCQDGPDAELNFSTEVELLARLHHCHVVPLLGYCSEFLGKNTERLLVFQHMPKGNLRDCLDGISGENLNWETRVNIAIGAARGLEYLHEAAAPKVLHRDVKSTNILLDENWRAKITDLGMAKSLRPDGVASGSNSPARMQGTFGYFAPEYAMIGRASLMSDVFSFGVVLLELITGHQPILMPNNKGEESLVLWATPRLQDSRRVITELPDPRLKGKFPEEEMQIMAYLAKECLLLDPDTRPTMSEVVQILSTIAPDKSRRRNLPASLFQTDSFRDKPWSQGPGSIDLDSENKISDTVSGECMERLVFLTSNTRSWRVTDEEAVDITEPRFESFCMSNTKTT